MKIPQLILASQSPQRQKLLTTLGIKFTIVPADIDEKSVADNRLEFRAQSIALAKAQKVATVYPEAFILAADTFTVLNNKIFEKPQTLIEAAQMLQLMSGQTIQDHTGLCFIDPIQQLCHTEAVITQAKFRNLSTKEIDRYVQNNPVLTWAAGFSAAYFEGMGLIAEVTGSLTGLTHGLPLEKVTKLLISAGIKF